METYAILWADDHALDREETEGLHRIDAPAADDPTQAFGVYEIDKRRAASLANSASVKAMARPMPVSLFDPLPATVNSVAAWGIAAVGADVSSFSGNGIKVAVLDTGIEKTHSAFAGINITERDLTGTGNGDQNGHGTHCAGTIFGRDIAGVRIGVARGVSDVYIGKVLDAKGAGTSQMVFDGLYWAIQNDVDVISMSLGFNFPHLVKTKHIVGGWPIDLATSYALELYRENLRMFDAIVAIGVAKRAFGCEPIIVAAAGNESQRAKNSQYRIAAGLPAVSTEFPVAALGQISTGQYRVADFSNSRPAISAPGVNILSAWIGNTTKSISGTSMACPHVAGTAALWAESLMTSLGSRQSGNVLRSYLIANARANVCGSPVDPVDVGSGLVSAP